jgi:hypothetical protein
MPESNDALGYIPFMTIEELNDMSQRIYDLGEELFKDGFTDFEVVDTEFQGGTVVGPVVYCVKKDLVQVRFWIQGGQYHVGCPTADGNWADIVTESHEGALESVKIILTAAEDGKISAEAKEINAEVNSTVDRN